MADTVSSSATSGPANWMSTGEPALNRDEENVTSTASTMGPVSSRQRAPISGLVRDRSSEGESSITTSARWAAE